MSSSLQRECERVARRARSMQIRDFRYSIDGDTVVLEGTSARPEAIDSVGRLFAATIAREVRNNVRLSGQGTALGCNPGFVHVVELGQHAARLVETLVYEVAPGDTLESIANLYYGSSDQAWKLRTANGNQIGADGHIRPGQKLRVPPPR